MEWKFHIFHSTTTMAIGEGKTPGDIIDISVPNTPTTVAGNVQKMTKPQLAMCMRIAFTFVFVIFFLMIISLFGMSLGIANNLNYCNHIVVSPFDDVVLEHKPQSTSTCYYPAMTSQLSHTYSCNFTNTYSTYYCPNGFACAKIEANGATPFACISETIACGDIDDCAASITSLLELNGTKIIETDVSVWPAGVSLGVTLVGVVVYTVLVFISTRPQFYNTLFKWLGGAYGALVVVLIVSLICYSIVLANVGGIEPSEAYGLAGNCYGNKEINSAASTADNIAFGYFEVFMFFCIFSLMAIVATVPYSLLFKSRYQQDEENL